MLAITLVTPTALNAEPNPPPDPRAWLQTPLGGYFAAWEQAQLDALLADIFGYNALQIGLADVDLLRANRMPLHICAAHVPWPDGEPARTARVLTNETALPFASASLDLVVLAHALEFSASPHHVLREVERVLVPEGSIVICGFNPYSLWNRRRRARGQWPWCGQYLSAPRVRDWLILLGFEVQSSRFGCYAPAVDSPEWLARWKWLDRIGRIWWPVCGAAWIVHGIKRVAGARLIQPHWREKYTRAQSLSPVARGSNDFGGPPGNARKETGEKCLFHAAPATGRHNTEGARPSHTGFSP
ncbi:MAG: class I SAM-dependent methyltransferase [Azoarcus sp.]|jgi:SAM-dependent methyltransferase|nr:class I SAM-dependent methyltransferase [Azoarcus sp.]